MSETLYPSFFSRAVPVLGHHGSLSLVKIALVTALWVGLGLLLAIAAPKSAESQPNVDHDSAAKAPIANSLPDRPI